MADIALKGDALKKMVAMAKKRDLNFAYCPGNDPKEDVFVLDRKKAPEVIGRIARAEGTGTKLGMGTAAVKGKVMSLTCERELPQMAKKLKKFLKFEGVKMNVVVLDQDGNVLEEDIEDLGEDDADDDVESAQYDDDDADDDAEDASDEAGDTEVDEAALLKSLKGRAAAVQAGIKAAPSDARGSMPGDFKAAVEALQGNDLKTADARLTMLERALASLPDAGNAADTRTEDPALVRLRAIAGLLLKRIEALGNAEGAARLGTAQQMLVTQIDGSDVKKASATAKALNEAIARLEGLGAADQKTDNASDAAATDAGADYRAARAELEPVILELLQKNLGDVGKMRAVLAYFTDKGDAEDYAGAMKAVPGLKKLIADAGNAGQTDAEKDIPANVVPFVRARLDWIKTRATLKSEMTKLQAEILAACQGEEFANIANDSKMLFTYLEALDTRLEDALEALVQAPDGDEREKLKERARKVLSEFQSELDTPFFQAVDSKNGFKPVNVRGAAIASLSKVSDALSAAA